MTELMSLNKRAASHLLSALQGFQGQEAPLNRTARDGGKEFTIVIGRYAKAILDVMEELGDKV